MNTSEFEKMRNELKKMSDKIDSGTLTELEILKAIEKGSKNLNKLKKALEEATDKKK